MDLGWREQIPAGSQRSDGRSPRVKINGKNMLNEQQGHTVNQGFGHVTQTLFCEVMMQVKYILICLSWWYYLMENSNSNSSP